MDKTVFGPMNLMDLLAKLAAGRLDAGYLLQDELCCRRRVAYSRAIDPRKRESALQRPRSVDFDDAK